jgi:osmotically inducible protein OsmC
VLEEVPYRFMTRFEHARGTIPEELIAAAHAACFSMAFANMLSGKGYKPIRVETRAVISMERLEGGFTITKMRLETEGEVSGLDQATFTEIARKASAGCPVGKLLRPGLEIELDARLLVPYLRDWPAQSHSRQTTTQKDTVAASRGKRVRSAATTR